MKNDIELKQAVLDNNQPINSLNISNLQPINEYSARTTKNLEGFRYIDLFAGIGGFHLAMSSFGAECVFASEWDSSAAKVYEDNFGLKPHGDITKIDESEIPYHDILCAGFPCQAFSISGKQKGFEDTRGTLFFDIARITKYHKPKILFLENVKTLLNTIMEIH